MTQRALCHTCRAPVLIATWEGRKIALQALSGRRLFHLVSSQGQEEQPRPASSDEPLFVNHLEVCPRMKVRGVR